MLSTEEQLANETKIRSQEHKRISDMEKVHLEMEKRMRDISDQVDHNEEVIYNNQIAASTQRSRIGEEVPKHKHLFEYAEDSAE